MAAGIEVKLGVRGAVAEVTFVGRGEGREELERGRRWGVLVVL